MSTLERNLRRLIDKLSRERMLREKSLAKDLLKIYEEARQALYIKFLEAKGGQDTLKLQYLEGTIQDIERQIKYYTGLTSAVRQKAIDEAFLLGQEVGAQMLAAGGVNVSVVAGIGLINRGMVEALIGNVPKLAGRVEDQILFRIRDELTRGAVMGESIPKIAKRILGTGLTQEGLKKPFPSIQKRCEVIARTEIIKASDAGYEDLAVKAQEVIGEEIYDAWITAGDDRVDAECRAIASGSDPRFKSIPGYPGVYRREEGPRPVISTHPRCRCRRIPYLLSWAESGALDLNELKGHRPGDDKPGAGKSDRGGQIEVSEKGIQPPKPAHELEIERLLKDAPVDSRRELARHLLNESDLRHIPLSIDHINYRGYCSLEVQDGKLKVTQMVLQQGDARPNHYQIKTVFHEITHARANGGAVSALTVERHLTEKLIKVEETVAETVAHYMSEKAGITSEIAPSYSNYLVINLPKLKKLPEFSGCNSISDFGKILAKYRYDFTDAQLTSLSELLDSQAFDLKEYAKQYESYVRQNIDSIVDLIYENQGQNNERLKPIIKDSILRNWQTYNSERANGFTDSLIIAMNRLGVK